MFLVCLHSRLLFYALGREKILVHLKDIFRCRRRSVVHPHRQCKGTKNSQALQIIIPKTIIFEGYFSPNFCKKLNAWKGEVQNSKMVLWYLVLWYFLLFWKMQGEAIRIYIYYNIYKFNNIYTYRIIYHLLPLPHFSMEK